MILMSKYKLKLHFIKYHYPVLSYFFIYLMDVNDSEQYIHFYLYDVANFRNTKNCFYLKVTIICIIIVATFPIVVFLILDLR